MPTTYEQITLKSSSREDIRSELVNIFLKEIPGTGTMESTSKYDYLVEKILLGAGIHNIILKRPAYLNKGFDFIVTYSDFNFNSGKKYFRDYKGVQKEYNLPKTSAPSHPHIIYDLKNKKKENESDYSLLNELINRIYRCEIIKETDYSSLNGKFTSGIPPEVILKLIKWLFIEQDITYWNFSGRAMLYESIKII